MTFGVAGPSTLTENKESDAAATELPTDFSSSTKPKKHIPRPPNAFILSKKAHGLTPVAAGLAWRSELAAVHLKYETLAAEALAQHKLDHPNYVYRPQKRAKIEKKAKIDDGENTLFTDAKAQRNGKKRGKTSRGRRRGARVKKVIDEPTPSVSPSIAPSSIFASSSRTFSPPADVLTPATSISSIPDTASPVPFNEWAGPAQDDFVSPSPPSGPFTYQAPFPQHVGAAADFNSEYFNPVLPVAFDFMGSASDPNQTWGYNVEQMVSSGNVSLYPDSHYA